jgi:hypothetical protein
VFHVPQFKPFTPDFTLVFSELPSASQLDLKDLEPDLILDRRLTKKGNTIVTQVLIKWARLPSSLDTWEDPVHGPATCSPMTKVKTVGPAHCLKAALHTVK